MYKIVFCILTILLILVLINNKENFDGNEEETCKFEIDKNTFSQQTLIDCIEECNTNEGCDVKVCQEKCMKCEGSNVSHQDKYVVCPWYEDLHPVKDHIEPLNIRGFPGDNKLLVEWRIPKSVHGIKYYVILVKENLHGGNNVIVKILQSGCHHCEFVVDKLKNKTTYSIMLKAVSHKNHIRNSNVITVEPNGADPLSIKSMYDEIDSDYDIAQQIRCSENINDEDHSLDKVDFSDIDLGKFIDDFVANLNQN